MFKERREYERVLMNRMGKVNKLEVLIGEEWFLWGFLSRWVGMRGYCYVCFFKNEMFE